MRVRERSGYSLGVAGIVVAEERVLLVRRMHEPNRGRWTFPSGYVEVAESVDEAVLREVKEETGVEAQIVGVIGLRNRVSPNDNNLLLFFLLRPGAGEPMPDGVEVDGARYFPFAEALGNPEVIELNRTVLRRVAEGEISPFLSEPCPPTPGLLARRYVAFL